MARVDISILEERANIFSLLRDIEDTLLKSYEKDTFFNLLYIVWEEASKELWFLGYWSDYIRCGKIVLHSAEYIKDIAVQAQLLGELGWAYMEWGQYSTAQEYFNESLQKYRAICDARSECRLLRYLGVLSHREGHTNCASDYYYQALDILIIERNKASSQERNMWTMSEAELHNMLGIYYIDLRDFSASYRELSLSLEQYRSIKTSDSCYYQAAPLLNWGKWHFLQGDYENAKCYYKECLELSKKICRPDTAAGALLRLAEVAEAEGKEEEALELVNESEKAAGTEIPSVRERAAIFKEKLLAKIALKS